MDNINEEIGDKNNAELFEIVEHKDKYPNDAVLEALYVLEKRAAMTPEMRSLKWSLEHASAAPEEGRSSLFDTDPNMTDDTTAPSLYTNRFILFFGVFFSVFAGGILMAVNLYRLEKKAEVNIIILLSLGYSALQMFILNRLPVQSSITIAASMLGVYLIHELYYKKQLAPGLKYQKRSFVSPLLIAFGLIVMLVYGLISIGGVEALR